MVKAFSTYSCPTNELNDLLTPHGASATVTSDDTITTESNDGSDASDDEASADEETNFNFDVSDGIDKYKADSDDITLPEHLRCCSHTLNLIATTDAESALNDNAYTKLYRQSMAKATALYVEYN